MNKLPKKMGIVLPDDLYEQICEYVSEYLTDKTGFCHKGFEIDVKVVARKIEWDTTE